MALDSKLLRGKPVAERTYTRLNTRIDKLRQRGQVPGLAVILVGDDPASKMYVGTKTRTFQRLDLITETFHLPSRAKQVEVEGVINRLNADPRFHGILVQMPLPDHLNSQAILERVAPLKDVDGLHPDNLGRLLAGRPRFIPCTPQGILEILEYYEISPQGKRAVIIGRSTLVGKPMMALLANKWERGNATVTVCHTGTRDLAEHTRQAELLIVASGQPGLITSEMVAEGAVVIDVGTNRVPDNSEKGYHIEGDVVTEDMLGLVQAITPVPGGVGPMTVAMLVSNTVLAAEISAVAI
ncbi:bifunctional 5,10-methylenetetrahydrofolate dehydrogenase/5,10-methenyltetrahydrofolate cyclohydrolase [Candidatus Neomarinimicrobiota bacterium]